MIATSRRGMMAGALAVPSLAGLPQWRWKHGERSVLVHDGALAAGRRFAAAGERHGAPSRAIEGDRIRFAREVLTGRPALIAGVSRHADFILLADAAREAGYRPVATIYGRLRQCAGHECQPGWQALGRMARMAGGHWVEALADYASRPGGVAEPDRVPTPGRPDAGLVLGWILAPRD